MNGMNGKPSGWFQIGRNESHGISSSAVVRVQAWIGAMMQSPVVPATLGGLRWRRAIDDRFASA